jgi:hypothetical protein
MTERSMEPAVVRIEFCLKNSYSGRHMPSTLNKWLHWLRDPLTPKEQAELDRDKAELKAMGDRAIDRGRRNRQKAKRVLKRLT